MPGAPKKKEAFGEYSKHHQSRIKKQLKEDCQATLTFLGLYNFMATKVQVFNTDTEQYDTFNLIDEDQLPRSATATNEAPTVTTTVSAQAMANSTLPIQGIHPPRPGSGCQTQRE